MAAYLDICRFNPTAGGTTDWTFSSAVTGYQSPALAGVVNARLYKYRAESSDLSQWELGEGAYTTSTGVLARTTVLFNNLGTTAKINFSSVPQVGIVNVNFIVTAVGTACGQILVPLTQVALQTTAGSAIDTSNGAINMVCQVSGSTMAII